jgi:hypothetical protein
MITFIFVARAGVMISLDAFICQENISLYKKLLADRSISDGQRDMVGKMLAEEEAKLLNLFNLSPSVQPESPV